MTSIDPRVAKLLAYFAERRPEESDSSLPEMKKALAQLLPKEALPKLKRIRSEENLSQLVLEHFPFLGGGLFLAAD